MNRDKHSGEGIRWELFDPQKLIYPLFVCGGRKVRLQIPLMEGIYRLSEANLIEEVRQAYFLGINRILLFGIPEGKDENGTHAYRRDNLVTKAVRTIKQALPQIVVMTDVCLCAYTLHGHCGIMEGSRIDRAATLDALTQIALSHAAAGADFVAPSAMADTQVARIRDTLDNYGYYDTRIMGYSAKFASHFYGPFRHIADSAPRFGDRRGYQLDYRQDQPAFDKVEQDIREGADIVMVKPALAYLDIIAQVKKRFSHPLAVYNVSGEYAMVKQGARAGLWKEKDMVHELLSAYRRAGADFIITYYAKDIARWRQDEKTKDHAYQK